MNEHTDRADQVGGDDDLGEPIAELRTLEEEVGTGFIARLLSALQRRSLVGQIATMVWTASAQAFFEFLGMIFSVFAPAETPKKEGRTNG
ncbi:MAG: hypothetical protein ABIF09_08455 [Gemmatimonadota bacterium]